MDSDRLSQLDENQLIARLDGIINEIETIKNTQFVGPASLRPRILSGKQEFYNADWSGTFWVINYTATFTANTQLNPYMLIFCELYDMGGAPLPWSILSGYNISQIQMQPNDGLIQQQLIVQTQATQFKIKFLAQASDSGRLQIFNNQTQTDLE